MADRDRYDEQARVSQVTERRAPVQGDPRIYGKAVYPTDAKRFTANGRKGLVPGTIAWGEHLEAWRWYEWAGHGDQSAERIAERGGFGYNELLDLLGHEPKTWEPR